MESALPNLLIIIVIVGFVLLRRTGKMTGRKANTQAKNRPARFVVPPKDTGAKPKTTSRSSGKKFSYAHFKAVSTERKEKENELAEALEDRKHDWLARQLAEERTIRFRGSLTDLGASHDYACDAKKLKKLHIFEHDDRIDEGNAK